MADFDGQDAAGHDVVEGARNMESAILTGNQQHLQAADP
jgi:hypothetical protein